MNGTSLDEYQRFTVTTAKYVGCGEGGSDAIAYTGFGFGGECGEAAEKIALVINPWQHPEILNELGDDFYYFARLSAETGNKLSEIVGTFIDEGASEDRLLSMYRSALVYTGRVGRVLERMKKVMRDGGGGTGGLPALASLHGSPTFRGDLVAAFSAFLNLVHTLGFSLEIVCSANRAKLTSRLERGVILGDGDKR